MSAVRVLTSILKLEENRLTVYCPAGPALWRRASWISSAPPPVVATTLTSLFRRLSLLPPAPLSLLFFQLSEVCGSPLSRNVLARVFSERAVFCPRIYKRVPPRIFLPQTRPRWRSCDPSPSAPPHTADQHFQFSSPKVDNSPFYAASECFCFLGIPAFSFQFPPGRRRLRFCRHFSLKVRRCVQTPAPRSKSRLG